MSSPPAEMAFSPAPSAALLAGVADALAWPLLVLRGDAALLHANLAGRRWLQRGAWLRLAPPQQVLPAQAQRRASFNADLQAVATTGTSLVLHWAADRDEGTALTATLSRLDPQTPALLLAVAGAESAGAAVESYAALHGLSAAETGVLRCLAGGDSSTRAAAALGVTPATVRSQILSLRKKTGHRSVAALLRALAALPPLAPAEGN